MLIHTFHPTHVLRSLVILRWLTLTGLLLLLWATTFWLHAPLPLPFILPALLAMLLSGMLADQQSRKLPHITDSLLLSQLIVDLLTLSWLLFCTGGASNPLASLLLLPLTFAAVTLPSRWVWGFASLTGGLYSLLVFYNIPLPPPEGALQALDRVLAETCSIGGHAGSSDGPGSGFALHVAGMWINVAISAVLIAYFLVKQTQSLREREQALHAFRERSLRNEQVLALGLLTAGAAHKLGTPLSTLAVLIHEQSPNAPIPAEDLQLLKDQISRCKDILSDMVHTATEPPVPLTVETWVRGWVDEWHLLRPHAALPSLRIAEDCKALTIQPERGLQQALQNLLDNAADATQSLPPSTATPVLIEVSHHADELIIQILDQGPGIPETLQGVLGMHFVRASDRPQPDQGGLGIGFFLTNATLEYAGGRLELFPREPQGTCTQITLPLAAPRT